MMMMMIILYIKYHNRQHYQGLTERCSNDKDTIIVHVLKTSVGVPAQLAVGDSILLIMEMSRFANEIEVR